MAERAKEGLPSGCMLPDNSGCATQDVTQCHPFACLRLPSHSFFSAYTTCEYIKYKVINSLVIKAFTFHFLPALQTPCNKINHLDTPLVLPDCRPGSTVNHHQ